MAVAKLTNTISTVHHIIPRDALITISQVDEPRAPLHGSITPADQAEWHRFGKQMTDWDHCEFSVLVRYQSSSMRLYGLDAKQLLSAHGWLKPCLCCGKYRVSKLSEYVDCMRCQNSAALQASIESEQQAERRNEQVLFGPD